MNSIETRPENVNVIIVCLAGPTLKITLKLFGQKTSQKIANLFGLGFFFHIDRHWNMSNLETK